MIIELMNYKELTKTLAAAAGALVFIFAVYGLVETVRESGSLTCNLEEKEKSYQKKRDLVYFLRELDNEGLDKSSLMIILRALLEYSAFNDAQNQINKLGYLPRIVNLLNHADNEVKQLSALLINNLSLNVENQVILRECIPQLTQILSTYSIDDEQSTELSNSVLCALTNLTTLDDSHYFLLNDINVIYEILQTCAVFKIKLQVLKILVNISTNKNICENMFDFDAELLRAVKPFISSDVEDALLLRSVSCFANVLESLHRKGCFGEQSVITSHELVSQKLLQEMRKLSSHHDEDIRFHAHRCVSALSDPGT